MQTDSEQLVQAEEESREKDSVSPALDDEYIENVDYGYENDPTEVVTSSGRLERRLNVMGEHCPYTISYRPGRFLFYSQPRQRQKWGESQILPRVNWGDLFFDLFYVGATYNVSNILSDSPNAEGFLYAAGTFIPLMGLWMDKVHYDARFVYEDDFCHQFLQVCYLVVLGTAVLHVRPVDIMSNASEDISIFMFAFMLVFGRVVMIVQYLDVYFFGVGQAPIVKIVALRAIKTMALATTFYLAAMIVAAVKYFGKSNENDAAAHHRILASANETSYAGDEGSTKTDNTNTPLILCLVGILCTQLSMVISVKFFFPGGGRHKESTIPLNVDLIIHRNGEWIMLMLGESIFSLLTVDVPEESSDFYAVFCLGILTVIHLQFLHFWSQPHHADSHAVRRHKDAGVWWTIFTIIYSLALLSLGASFTIFLMLSTESNARRRYLSSSSSALDTEQLKEYASHLFSAMLATIFACLDVMTVLHLGLKESQERCVCKETRERNRKGIILLALRLGLIVFTGTLSQWRDDPKELCFIGFLCVFAQLVLRQLGDLYLGHIQVHASSHMSAGPKSDEEIGEGQWPNVTHARAESQEEED